jgi:predicted small lipoprotein YifL
MLQSTPSLVPRAFGLFRLVALLALGAMLSGCGQKGPLFMPGQPKLQMAPTQAETVSPATSDRLANR